MQRLQAATVTHIRTQISCDKGFMKLNTPGVCFTGFLIIMEMRQRHEGLAKVDDTFAFSGNRHGGNGNIRFL